MNGLMDKYIFKVNWYICIYIYIISIFKIRNYMVWDQQTDMTSFNFVYLFVYYIYSPEDK